MIWNEVVGKTNVMPKCIGKMLIGFVRTVKELDRFHGIVC